MTGRNLSDYIMKTKQEFYKRRYGGFEFGVLNPIKDVNLTSVEKNLELILKKLPGVEYPGLVAQYLKGQLETIVQVKLDNIRVWFNNKGWSTSVGYLNAVNNLVLRASIQDEDNEDNFFKDPTQYGISVINHPMNFTEKQLNEKNM